MILEGNFYHCISQTFIYLKKNCHLCLVSFAALVIKYCPFWFKGSYTNSNKNQRTLKVEGKEFSEMQDQENWIQPNDPKTTKNKVLWTICLNRRVSISRELIVLDYQMCFKRILSLEQIRVLLWAFMFLKFGWVDSL